ncbi:trigger factor [Thiothrix eikelboomii]|uniref:Trigger factor n=1 Tax=Thiothrix eikelboomii TaxID=92487 RepID=A0A1T4VSJ1_9GAMM|nr:trigger factor [Thiothrix eikelboomii]SKA67808.1 trigger factor [Thiothrix eikelboomii]
MQVSVESTGSIGRKMTVEVPAERIEQSVESRLKSMVKRVRLDGFRPGKVPFNVVKSRYSDSVRQEVIGEVLENTFRDASVQQNLRVAGLPQIELQALAVGQPLVYVANFDVYPEFVVADVTGLELKRPVAEVQDADIDNMLNTILKQQREWKDVERAAQSGDLVRIDFEGSVDGETFAGGTAQDYPVELGAGRMLPDFEAALMGMSAGETKTAEVAFPEDYQAENLKGKTAQFKLTVHKVQEESLPELNEEFIKQFGVDDGSLESFRAEVKKNMTRELGNALKAQVKQQVMEGLSNLHEIDLPSALVKDEIQHVREEFSQSTGNSADNIPDDLFQPQAARRVKLGLIVGEIIRQKGLQRDPARVDAMLETLAASYEDPAALINYYRTNRQAMQTVEAAVMEDMIVEWVLAQAQVTDEARDFESVMNRKQAPAAA